MQFQLPSVDWRRLEDRLRRVPDAARALRQRYPQVDRWVLAGVAVFAAAALVVAADVLITTPSPTELRGLAEMPVATRVYDRHDAPAFSIYQERRHEIPLSAMSPHLIAAVLAIEDQRFYAHRGIDPWRIGGAAIANLRSGRRVQGGSTITQQLARLSFLTPEKSLRRKLKEVYLALRIERHFTKDQILEAYLNKVYLGDGLYGAEAASRGYFDKPASALSPDEAALLAGLIQAPSAYDPTSHPERAMARRRVVLDQMVEAGSMTRPVADLLGDAELRLVDGFADEDDGGGYFRNAVTRQLVDRFGWDLVSRGGLTVHTTLDQPMQRAAEQAVADGIERIEDMAGFARARRTDAASADAPDDRLQAALVAIDPASGAVRAIVGGRDFAGSQFDRAIQAKRQAGSAFKPFVFAAALDMGYTPATLVTDLAEPMATPEGAWIPADGHGDEPVTVRTALRTSSNRAAVQVLRDVGIPRAVSYAERLGVPAPPVPSLVLGSGDVSLLSITAAYGVFAAAGVRHPPVLIRRVEDALGRVLYEAEASPEQVLGEDTAFLMAQMLRDVVDRGTGYRVRQAGFRLPAAGKTGTTNDYHDAWFIGFTPDLVAGVWLGFDQPRTIMGNGYATHLAAPVWGRFMHAVEGLSGEWIARPDNVVTAEICRVSGLRPGPGCTHVPTVDDDGDVEWTSAVGVEFFKRGTVPAAICQVHASRPAGERGFWSRLFGGLLGGGGGGGLP